MDRPARQLVAFQVAAPILGERSFVALSGTHYRHDAFGVWLTADDAVPWSAIVHTRWGATLTPRRDSDAK